MPKKEEKADVAATQKLPNVLRLTLKKKWYDLILLGEKKEEYREIKSFWSIRFSGYSLPHGLDKIMKNKKQFSFVEFKNGYGKDAPIMFVEFKGLRIGEAKPEWSDNWQGEVFVISLGAVLHSK